MTQRTIAVTGMACDGCEENVESELASLAGVSEVRADHETDTVELTGEVDDDELAAAIRSAGYEIE